MWPRMAGATWRLQVFLGLVLGELIELIGHFAVDGRAAAGGDEIVAVDAGLQGSLVAVDRGTPGVFGVGGLAPGSMLPDDVEIAEVERGRLGVGDVGLAPFRPGCRRWS